jgi:hypothetical protein
MKDLFEKEVTDEIIARINRLTPDSAPQWGKMNVAQMLAHCNVTYAYTYEPHTFKRPHFLMRFLLKTVIRKYVTSPKPYRRNGKTAPDFIITDQRQFDVEKQKLLGNVVKTQQLGRAHFEGLENMSFGRMSSQEWNTMFYKHLDHHLRQFSA